MLIPLKSAMQVSIMSPLPSAATVNLRR
jgi:hypothetical protein